MQLQDAFSLTKGSVTNLCFCYNSDILCGIFLSECMSNPAVFPHLYLPIDVLLTCFLQKLLICGPVFWITSPLDPQNPSIAAIDVKLKYTFYFLSYKPWTSNWWTFKHSKASQKLLSPFECAYVLQCTSICWNVAAKIREVLNAIDDFVANMQWSVDEILYYTVINFRLFLRGRL
jgi:hypothetical protein